MLSLTGCASSSHYTAANDAGDTGYYSQKISSDRIRVGFNGDRHTDLEETRSFALLRAAELTVVEGFDWFRIVERESRSTKTLYPHEAYSSFGYERAYTRTTRCGLLSCSDSLHPTVTHAGGINDDKPVSKHSYTIEIVMGAGDKPADADCYDARKLIKDGGNERT